MPENKQPSEPRQEHEQPKQLDDQPGAAGDGRILRMDSPGCAIIISRPGLQSETLLIQTTT